MTHRPLTAVLLTALLFAPPAWAVSDVKEKPRRRGPLRVLLFAGGPSREYQFVRRLLAREVKAKRLEVGVFLQGNTEEEINLKTNRPQEWVLNHFPNRRTSAKPADRPYTLATYDVVIAFDPDWKALKDAEVKLLAAWVKGQMGGLVLVAGPVHTAALAGKGKKPDLTPLRKLLPVTLAGADKQTRAFPPLPLTFPDAKKAPGFLKLDPGRKGNLAGWDEYFYGGPMKGEDKVYRALRGFFSSYPVKKAKKGAKVAATFGKDRRPFLVTGTHGSGRVVFLGSGEMWRLRKYRAAFHQRFWIGLVGYAANRPVK
jgi:hypothetical protein